MQIDLRIRKHGKTLCEGRYDVTDAESFGKACADAWERLQAQRLVQTTSIGALFDVLNEQLDELEGAEISVARA